MACGLARRCPGTVIQWCQCVLIGSSLALAQVAPAVPRIPSVEAPPLPGRPRVPLRQRPVQPVPSAPQIPVVVGYPSPQPAPLPFEIGLGYSYNAFDAGASGPTFESGASLYGEYFFKPTAELPAGRAVFGLRADLPAAAAIRRTSVYWTSSSLAGNGFRVWHEGGIRSGVRATQALARRYSGLGGPWGPVGPTVIARITGLAVHFFALTPKLLSGILLPYWSAPF